MRKVKIPLNKSQFPLVNPGKVDVPRKIEVPIFLIRHELKLRMVYQTLETIATVDCYFESHLDRLILASLQMWDTTDETYEFYFSLMNKWTKEVDSDPDVITRRALKIYNALMKYRDSKKAK